MAIGDVMEVSIKYDDLTNASVYVNVLHLRCSAFTGFDEDESQIATDVALFVRTTLMLRLNANIVLNSVVAQIINPLPRSAGATASGLSTAGSIAGDMLPPQCALIIRKRTAYAGRKFRGRIYQCGLSESDQAAGTWAGGNADNVRVAWISELTTPKVTTGGNEWNYVVCNRRGDAPQYQITSATRDPRVRTQRRRVRGVGS